MAGEQSKSDLTPEEYPYHFAVAEALEGTVEPFDVYQGPYVKLPNRRLFLCEIEDGAPELHWFDDVERVVSPAFWHEGATEQAIEAAALLFNHDGGVPVDVWEAEQAERRRIVETSKVEVWRFAEELWGTGWAEHIERHYPSLAVVLREATA